MVLASGETVTASAEENPDLFWAIRGGGGNFGVVTSFLFRLHEVGTIVGGPTFWAVEDAAEVLRAYRDFLPAAPRELNGFFAFASVPPAPPFPEELHLRKVCGVVWCYSGAPEDAAAAMAPLLEATPEPLMHGVQEMPLPALQGAFDPVYPAGDQWYWRADFVKEIPDAAVEAHAKFGAAMPTWQSTMHLYPIDGAAHDVAATDTAWAYRDAHWGSVFAGVDNDPANAEKISRWCVEYFEALHPYSAGGAYVNMMMDEGQERVRASYGANYDRLAQIKAGLRPGQPLPDQPEHPAGRGLSGALGHGVPPSGAQVPGSAADEQRMGTPEVSKRPHEAGAYVQAHADMLRRRLLVAVLAFLAISAVAFLALHGRVCC